MGLVERLLYFTALGILTGNLIGTLFRFPTWEGANIACIGSISAHRS
jgi:hypothetical protein